MEFTKDAYHYFEEGILRVQLFPKQFRPVNPPPHFVDPLDNKAYTLHREDVIVNGLECFGFYPNEHYKLRRIFDKAPTTEMLNRVDHYQTKQSAEEIAKMLRQQRVDIEELKKRPTTFNVQVAHNSKKPGPRPLPRRPDDLSARSHNSHQVDDDLASLYDPGTARSSCSNVQAPITERQTSRTARSVVPPIEMPLKTKPARDISPIPNEILSQCNTERTARTERSQRDQLTERTDRSQQTARTQRSARTHHKQRERKLSEFTDLPEDVRELQRLCEVEESKTSRTCDLQVERVKKTTRDPTRELQKCDTPPSPRYGQDYPSTVSRSNFGQSLLGKNTILIGANVVQVTKGSVQAVLCRRGTVSTNYRNSDEEFSVQITAD